MFVRYFFSIIIFFILLTGCNIENRNDEKGHKEIVTEVKESRVQNNSLENKILPPKFSIISFELDYISEDKELLFLMNYEIDDEIYKILQNEDQQMYFSLEYPEILFSILDSTNSQLLLAEKPTKYNTKYQAQFKINKVLSDKELETVKNNLSGFNLIVADKDKDAIAHYIDLNGFNNFDPVTSNSTHISDTE